MPHGRWKSERSVCSGSDKVIARGCRTCAKEISVACSLFISLGGNIGFTVTGSRHYSSDLIQGGLEICFRLVFKGEAGLVKKIRKLVKPLEYKKQKIRRKND